MSLTPDQIVLNKYHIRKLIGEGGNGRVWLAEETTFSHRPVAIKEARTELPAAELAEVQRICQQEVDICSRLEQARAPNLVRAFTVEPYNQHLLLVMAYLPGGDLGQLLRTQAGPLPIDQALSIVQDILAPLQVAHNHPDEIIHRDIKPQNILFDEAGRAYLGDWGLAQLSGASQRSQVNARSHPGTRLYMAPEQADRSDYLLPSADIYAVGCVLFEILTGARYKHQRPGTLASTLRPDLPAWLDQVLSKALAEDPFDRYPNAGALAAALTTVPLPKPNKPGAETKGTLALHSPIEAQPRLPARKAASWRQRWVGAAMATVALFTAGLLYWQNGNTDLPTVTASATATQRPAEPSTPTVPTPTETKSQAVAVATATFAPTAMPTEPPTPLPTTPPTPLPTSLPTPTSFVVAPSCVPDFYTSGAERIQFAKGAISATRFDSLPGCASKQYVLWAGKGQTMSISVSAAHENVAVAISDESGREYQAASAGSTSWVDVLPAGQNYYITVVSLGVNPTDYSLEVVIPPL